MTYYKTNPTTAAIASPKHSTDDGCLPFLNDKFDTLLADTFASSCSPLPSTNPANDKYTLADLLISLLHICRPADQASPTPTPASDCNPSPHIHKKPAGPTLAHDSDHLIQAITLLSPPSSSSPPLAYTIDNLKTLKVERAGVIEPYKNDSLSLANGLHLLVLTVIDRVSRALSPRLTPSSPLITDTAAGVSYPLLTEFTLWSYITPPPPSLSTSPASTKSDIPGSSRPAEVTTTSTITTTFTDSSSNARLPQVPSDPSPYTKITDLKTPKPSFPITITGNAMDKSTLEHSHAYLLRCNNSLTDRILALLSSLALHDTHQSSRIDNATNTTNTNTPTTAVYDKSVSTDRILQLSSTPQSSITLLHLIYSLLRYILIHHYTITHNWNTTTSIFMEHIHLCNLYIAGAESATEAGSTKMGTTTASTMPWQYMSVQYTWIETCLRKRKEMCDITSYPPLTLEEVKLREAVDTHLS